MMEGAIIMKSSLLVVIMSIVISWLLVLPAATLAQPGEASTENPPLSQPLIREGDFAVDLAGALNLGGAPNEVEAESRLNAVGIAPRNGWIADYPMTPDVIGEVQASLGEAADAGKLVQTKDTALKAFQNIIAGQGLPVRAAEGQDMGPQEAYSTADTTYPDATAMNNYYGNEGPPVVSYYAPPPDYAYMYTWVPYPFWWTDFWFPGFFVLADFDIRGHGHEHGHGHGHDHGGGGIISNHFHDPKTGGVVRIDPTNRAYGGTLSVRGGTRMATPSARSGAQEILNKSPRRVGEDTKAFRGYGVASSPSEGNRSSAFVHSGSSQVERAASDRGFQSRSSAGNVAVAPASSGGRAVAPAPRGGAGVPRGGGVGGFHGGGGRR